MGDKSSVSAGMFSLGRLEGWIEQVGKQFQLVVTEPLKQLKVVEQVFRSIPDQLCKEATDVIMASAEEQHAEASDANFRFDWPDSDVCCVVMTGGDGAEPMGLGYAYLFNGSPMMETTWAPHCLTLGDWQKALKFVEDNKGRLPAARSSRLKPLP